MMNKLHKCSRVGLLSLALKHPISQPNSLDFSPLAQASQKGRGERSNNGAHMFWLKIGEELWREREREYKYHHVGDRDA